MMRVRGFTQDGSAAPFERVSAEFGRSPEQHDDNRLTCTLAPLDPVMLKLTGVPERK